MKITFSFSKYFQDLLLYKGFVSASFCETQLKAKHYSIRNKEVMMNNEVHKLIIAGVSFHPITAKHFVAKAMHFTWNN